MIVPISELSPDTLYNLVESFVLREGTDYGELEVPLETKVAQVITQLKAGELTLLYSELHESVNIVPTSGLGQAED